MSLSPSQLAAALDSTNLRLDATESDIVTLCEEAACEQYACVMLYPSSVPLAARVLAGTTIGIGTVVGFPSGRFSTSAKTAEIVAAARAGAAEVDVVMDYAALREGRLAEVGQEIALLSRQAHELGLRIKVITENCFLDEKSKLAALRICEEAGADFIKTSTGFGTGGATASDLSLWSGARRSGIRLKAAGGIRSLADARAFLAAGAVRLGTSGAGALMRECRGQAAAPGGRSGY